MKTVNFAVAMHNLKGDTLKDETGEAALASVVLANTLVQVKAKQPLRQMDIARKIYASKEALQLEDSDFKIVEDVIKASDFTCVVAATLEQCLKLAKEVKEVEPKDLPQS